MSDHNTYCPGCNYPETACICIQLRVKPCQLVNEGPPVKPSPLVNKEPQAPTGTPEPEVRPERCAVCKWWEHEKEDIGECHRYAPRPEVPLGEVDDWAHFPVWPLTLLDEFCGEFEPQERSNLPWPTRTS